MVASQSLKWQPRQINENNLTRVAVEPDSLTWFQTDFHGIWFGCFESDHEVQEHPVTMLTRFDPGGAFPLHGHPGGEEILVLDGYFADETGIHPPGTYMLNPEGFIHTPQSEKGCLTYVKLRQHGGTTRHQIRTNIYEGTWQPSRIPGIEVQPIYTQEGFTEKVWAERWQPGTALSEAIETEVKEIFIIEGTWRDELGTYPTHTWLRYVPDETYRPASDTGCLIYVKTYPVCTERFIVGKDFRQPYETQD